MPIDTSMYRNMQLPDFVGSYMRGKEFGDDQRAKEQKQVVEAAKRGAMSLGEDGKMTINPEGFEAYSKVAPMEAYELERGLKKNQMDDQKNQMATTIQQYDLVGRTLGGVKNQEQYTKALQALERAGVDREDIDAMPSLFDQDTVRNIAGRSFTQKDRLAEQARQQGFDFDKEKFSYQKERDAKDFGLRSKKMSMDQAKAEREANQSVKGKELSQAMVKNINEGNQIPSMLQDVTNSINVNKDIFGPVEGRLRENNPYDEKGQAINAQLRVSSQAFGRFMEGGVLRKEDEEKYRKMFPKLSDTPETAANKLSIVKRLLQQKQESDIAAFSAQGYNLEGLDKGFAKEEVPGIIAGKQPGSMINVSDDQLEQMDDAQLDQMLKEAGL